MKLVLRSIIAAGDLDDERLTLRANQDLDIGDFLVARTQHHDGYPSTELENTFWFPFKEIDKGDLVVVYSKSGSQRTRMLDSGRKAHFFYLNSSKPIWNDHNYAPIVIETPSYEMIPQGELRARSRKT